MYKEKEISGFWNVVKGLGIFFVVLGHSGFPYTNFVYQFHLVLFLFVSGYFFNAKGFDLRLFSKGKFRSLYFPTLKYRLFFALAHNLLVWVGIYAVGSGLGYRGIQQTFISILNSFTLLSSPGVIGALWFVPFLLGTLILFFVISWIGKLFQRNELFGSKYLLLLFSSIMATIGLFMYLRGWYSRWELNCLICLPIVAAGFYIKTNRVEIKYSWWGVLLSFIALSFFFAKKNIIDLATPTIGNPLLFYPISFIGIYFCLAVSHYLCKSRWIEAIFDYLGSISLHIMALHFLSFKIIGLLMVSLGIGNFTKLDVATSRFINGDYWALYTLVGLCLPSLLILSWSCISARWNEKNC